MNTKKMVFMDHFKNLEIPVVLGLLGMHVLAVWALWHFSVSALLIAIFLYWLRAWVGITLCYHRLLTHRSFKTKKWLEYVLTVIAQLALQAGPFKWIYNHRKHHQHPDEEGDPHSTNDGFGWAHVFWLCYKPKEKMDMRVIQDLTSDKGMTLIDRYFWLPQLLLAIGLFLGGILYKDTEMGLSFMLWGVGVSTVAVYHATWFVNSACHTWGYRNFETNDRSYNLWWVALLSGGEGWHNNHHAHASSPRHGLRWYEIDPTFWEIKILEFIGLVKSLKRVPEVPQKT